MVGMIEDASLIRFLISKGGSTMTKTHETKDQATRWLRWTARIWSAPLIVFAVMMLVGYAWNWATLGTPDPYVVEGTSLIEALPPIFMFLSVLGLAFAWRWEGWGAAIALGFQLATIVSLLVQGPNTDDPLRASIPYLMVLVIVIPAVLFLVSWRRARNQPLK
jgi:hypothetical protein